MDGLKGKISGLTQKPAGRVPVPMGWGRSDQSALLRGMCEGPSESLAPNSLKEEWEAQEPAQKTRSLAAGPGEEGSAAARARRS